MKKWLGGCLIAGGAFAVLAIILFAIFGGTYNGLVNKREAAKTQWAQVETQYQRRFDLVPNLVGAVKGSMKQEKEVFGAIAEARTQYAGAKGVEQKVDAANRMESALARLLVIMENYPQLQSSQLVSNLMVQLEGTENRISTERKRYNKDVNIYNVTVKSFPTMFFANIFGFKPMKLFKSVKEAEKAPKVQF